MVPGREYLELWFSMARKHWGSAVLVPADAGESAAVVASSLAEVGRQLRVPPVTALVAERLDFAAAARLTELVDSARAGPLGAGPPSGQVIVAIPPVVVEPLGVAVTRAADLVIVCIELGQSGLIAARRTVQLIGRERVAGAFLIRRRASPAARGS
jgi:hypothetical protein